MKRRSNRSPVAAVMLATMALFTSIPTLAALKQKPIKVFILAGQSNMQGAGIIKADPQRNGGKGSLETLVKDPATAKRFAPLVDKDGNWRTRNDVWISYLDRNGPLTVGYGARRETIGPELGFGWVMGDALDEPVLLIKCAWGGRSLAVDFRPPSAGKPPYSLGVKEDDAIQQDPNIIGKYYREILALTKPRLPTSKISCRAVMDGMCWQALAGTKGGTTASMTISMPNTKATWSISFEKTSALNSSGRDSDASPSVVGLISEQGRLKRGRCSFRNSSALPKLRPTLRPSAVHGLSQVRNVDRLPHGLSMDRWRPIPGIVSYTNRPSSNTIGAPRRKRSCKPWWRN